MIFSGKKVGSIFIKIFYLTLLQRRQNVERRPLQRLELERFVFEPRRTT